MRNAILLLSALLIYSCFDKKQASLSVTLIRDGKILKTIENYVAPLPEDLEFGMISMSYPYQKVPESKFSVFWKGYVISSFQNEGENYFLSSSEAFYLQALLEKAPESKRIATPVYRLTGTCFGNLGEANPGPRASQVWEPGLGC